MHNNIGNLPKVGRRWQRIIVAVFAVIFLLSACSEEKEPSTIRLALLPILDALPMYVAEEQGYFEAENLTVEFIPVTSAAERDQIIQAGRADGMINEILSAMFYNELETQVMIVRYARVAYPDSPHFRILASANSGIDSVDALRGQEIGISEGTIIEYSTDRLLEAEGLSQDEIRTIAVPRIPDRLALLNSGELPAANLPEPLASLAIQSGARVIVDDSSHPEFGHSVISFRKEFIEDNPDAINRFLSALERAVVDINRDKEQFSDVLVERKLVPEPIMGSYTVPDFPESSVPSILQWEDVLAWAKNEGYVDTDLNYSDTVDDSFLP